MNTKRQNIKKSERKLSSRVALIPHDMILARSTSLERHSEISLMKDDDVVNGLGSVGIKDTR